MLRQISRHNASRFAEREVHQACCQNMAIFEPFFFRTLFFDFFSFKRTVLKLKVRREHKYIYYPYQFHVNRISLRSLKARSNAIFKRCAWFDSFISNLGSFQVMNDLGASLEPLIKGHLESVNDVM